MKESKQDKPGEQLRLEGERFSIYRKVELRRGKTRKGRIHSEKELTDNVPVENVELVVSKSIDDMVEEVDRKIVTSSVHQEATCVCERKRE
jgi:hypothetical protein